MWKRIILRIWKITSLFAKYLKLWFNVSSLHTVLKRAENAVNPCDDFWDTITLKHQFISYPSTVVNIGYRLSQYDRVVYPIILDLQLFENIVIDMFEFSLMVKEIVIKWLFIIWFGIIEVFDHVSKDNTSERVPVPGDNGSKYEIWLCLRAVPLIEG